MQEVRDRIIVVCRLLNLSRSIDLARTWRCQSQVGDQVYVLTQRKGQKKHQWECLVRLDRNPALSRMHVMRAYVSLTSALVPAGSLLLRQLHPPYKPLVANTVGSITKTFYVILVVLRSLVIGGNAG